MTSKPSSPRYYHNPRDTLKQLPQLLPIVLVFILTIWFASGFENQTTRTVIMYLSLVYPAVILFSLSFSIPSYYQLDSDGIHVTILGLVHRHIYWSDVESIGPAAIGHVKGIGLTYRASFSHYVFGRKSRRRMWGWDEILSNTHTEAGASFEDAVTKHFKKHLNSIL